MNHVIANICLIFYVSAIVLTGLTSVILIGRMLYRDIRAGKI